MNTKKNQISGLTINIIWIFLILYTLNGCETIVEVDLPEHPPMLVANSLFNQHDSWQVLLHKSKNSLDRSSNSPILNATVEIFQDNRIITSLTHTGSGVYHSPQYIKPEIGIEYVLKASAPSYDPIEATDYVPIPVQIESVDYDISSNPFKFTIHFTDPLETKNYYQVQLLTPVAEGNSFLTQVWWESNDLLFQDLGGGDPNISLFDDALISGESYSLKLKAYPHSVEPLRQIYVSLLSVSESYYNYMKSSKNQDDKGDNPFSTPVQVYNNIENGLGIFAGYGVSIVAVF